MKIAITYLNGYYRVIYIWSDGSLSYHRVCSSKTNAVAVAIGQAKFYACEYAGEYIGGTR